MKTRITREAVKKKKWQNLVTGFKIKSKEVKDDFKCLGQASSIAGLVLEKGKCKYETQALERR